MPVLQSGDLLRSFSQNKLYLNPASWNETLQLFLQFKSSWEPWKQQDSIWLASELAWPACVIAALLLSWASCSLHGVLEDESVLWNGFGDLVRCVILSLAVDVPSTILIDC